MAEDQEHAKLEMVEEGIALVTLNRPEKGNAHTIQMRQCLDRFFRQCDDDDAVRVIVVTGAGKAFCVGADLGSGGSSFDRTPEERKASNNDNRVFGFQLKKPVIAAINGHAAGVGITMPLGWDIIIVSEKAKLVFPFVRRGIAPELASSWLLPRLIGPGRAIELMLTGRVFSGAEAVKYGLAQEALPAEQVLPRALEIARDIRDNCAPVSVAMTKKMIWDNLQSTDIMAAVVMEDKSWQWAGTQPDAKEGVKAFLEKRKPQWTMKPSSDMPEFHST